MSEHITLRVPNGTKRALEQIAESHPTETTKSAVAREGVLQMIERAESHGVVTRPKALGSGERLSFTPLDEL
jgi:predicted transcriptional regulator